MNNIRLIGRTSYDEKKKAHIFGWTCSGFEIRFEGTTVKALLISDNPEEEFKKAYVTVVLDDTVYKVIKLDKKEDVYVLCDNIPYGTHKLKVLKRSECCMSYAGLKDLYTDGKILEPDEVSFDMKIEFIGDSITCGYGNVAKTPGEPFSTESEDGLQSYAYIAAQELNAEANMICVSGWAADKSPYGRSMQEIYEYTNYFHDRSKSKWDFNKFIPDVVVLALGSNDNAYVLNDRDKLPEFTDGYERFLLKLTSLYPSSQILCILGTLVSPDSLVFEGIEQAIGRVNNSRISFLKLDLINIAEDSLGAGHPTVKTHIKDARQLVEKIRDLKS